MKKLSFICALVMLLSIIGAIPIAAAEQPSLVLTPDKTAYARGDEVTVTIDLKNNPGLMIVAFSMTYDTNALTLVSNGDKKLLGNSMSNSDVKVYPYPYAWYTPDFHNTTVNDVIAEPVFKINDNARFGKYEINIEYGANGDVVNEDSVNVPLTVVKAVIEIVCPHANKTAVAAVPGTCVAEGTKAHEKCDDCGKLLLDGKEVTEAELVGEKDPENHDGEEEIRDVVAATEEAEGYTGDTYCTGCNQIKKKGEKTDKLDHTHDMEHTAATAPTCTEDGVLEHWTCTKCGNIYANEAGTEKLESTVDPKLGHKTEVKDAKEATCTEDGYTGDTVCSVCGDTVKGEVIPAKGHTYETVDAKEATCGEDGYTGDKVCSVCDDTVKGEVIPATGDHKNTEVRDAKKADCIHDGYTGDTYCTDCGNEIETGTVTDPTGVHNFAWVTDKEATLDEAGLEHQECTVCKEPGESREIPKIDCLHPNMEHHEKVDATCELSGNVEYWHCSTCDRNYSNAEGTSLLTTPVEIAIDPANHAKAEHHAKVAATCSKDGSNEYWHCNGCDKNFSDEACTQEIAADKFDETIVIPADPTSHVNTTTINAVAATCSSTGYSGDTYCNDCQKTVAHGTVTPVDPNAHSFRYNRCDYCLMAQSIYYPPTYKYVDDNNHMINGRLEAHTPDFRGSQTDGVYEWHCCRYCLRNYGKILIEDSTVVEVDDPVQSDDVEVVEEVETETTETSVVTPVEDTNPKTGIAFALIPMVMALIAAAATKIKK